MTAPVTFTRTTYTNNDTLSATQFNAQSAVSATVPNAEAAVLGVIQLTGDLAGTAAAPAIAANAVTTAKIADAQVTSAKTTVTTEEVSASPVSLAVTDASEHAMQQFVFGDLPAGNIAGTFQFQVTSVDDVDGTTGTVWILKIKNGATVLRTIYIKALGTGLGVNGPYCANFQIAGYAGGVLTLDVTATKSSANNATLKLGAGFYVNYMVIIAGL